MFGDIATAEVLLTLSLTRDGVVCAEDRSAGEMVSGGKVSSNMAGGARSDEVVERQSQRWCVVAAGFVDGDDVCDDETGVS